MDADRLRRYQTKLAHARRTHAEASAWLDQASGSRLHLLACYKAFQETVEAVTDLAAMRVKDSGRVPLDDYGNLEALQERGDFKAPTSAALAKANGLRNRLVHEYNGLWDDVAVEAIEELLAPLSQALDEVSIWE